MSVIKGRFIYHAFYNSIYEMREDKNLEVGYFVSVIDGNKKNDYKIVDKITDSKAIYESLVNGLFALSVILSNETTVDLDKPYQTEGPIDSSVGSILRGSEFYVKDTNDLFDKMFYGSWCSVELSTNLTGDLIKGEQNVLSYLKIRINRSSQKIVKVKINIGEYERIIEERWLPGDHVVNLDLIIRETTDVIVTLYSEIGETYTSRLEIYESYPSYYSSIGSAVEPSPVSIKQMNKSFRDSFEYTTNYNSTRFFVAVPTTKVLRSVKDESECELLNDMVRYSVNIIQGNDTIQYYCYYLENSMIVNGFKFTARMEDV